MGVFNYQGMEGTSHGVERLSLTGRFEMCALNHRSFFLYFISPDPHPHSQTQTHNLQTSSLSSMSIHKRGKGLRCCVHGGCEVR